MISSLSQISVAHGKSRFTYLCILQLICAWLFYWGISCPVSAQKLSSKVLEKIHRSGEIDVGVKTDFALFGHMNKQGNPEGFEVDLAKEIASRLGVRLNLVSITTENRFQKLENDDIDLLIATTADTKERREISTAIEPNYYAGSVSLFMRPEQNMQNWQAIRGQKVCATQGSYFNRPMSQRYLLDLIIYRSTRDALLALRDGRCIGFLYSTAAIQNYLHKPEWQTYKSALPPAMVAPWSINLARNEKDSEFAVWIGDQIADWHRNGFLIQLEKKWGIAPSIFLADMHLLWSKRGVDGRFICERDKNIAWPLSCRNPGFVRSDEVSGLLKFGLWLKEVSGLNLSFVYDTYDSHLFFRGLLYSFGLMLLCILLSIFLGLSASLFYANSGNFFQFLLKSVCVFARMSPPLLWMYLIFFGLGPYVYLHWQIHFSAFSVALLCLSGYTGASIMQTCLDALQHLQTDQPQFQLRFNTLPRLLDICSVPIKASLINVTKQSVLASALAVPELISSATAIMVDQGNIGVMMNAFLCFFLLLVSLCMLGIEGLERICQSLHRS